MNDLVKRLQQTDRCYCGSEVVDGELKLVACLFHQAADVLEQKDMQIEDLEEGLLKIVDLAAATVDESDRMDCQGHTKS